MTMSNIAPYSVAVICMFSIHAMTFGEDMTEKGSLVGKVLANFEPVGQTIEVLADTNVLGQRIPDDSLLVNKNNKGIANVVIWMRPLELKEDDPRLSKDVAKKQCTIEIDKGHFRPHIAVVKAGSTLSFSVKDGLSYIPDLFPLRDQKWISEVSATNIMNRKFVVSEPMPVRVECGRHPGLGSWVIVSDHDFIAVSGENGAFALENIPTGEWEWVLWHERSGIIQEAVIDGKSEKWPKHGRKVRIENGNNSFGEVLLKRYQIEPKQAAKEGEKK